MWYKKLFYQRLHELIKNPGEHSKYIGFKSIDFLLQVYLSNFFTAKSKHEIIYTTGDWRKKSERKGLVVLLPYKNFEICI